MNYDSNQFLQTRDNCSTIININNAAICGIVDVDAVVANAEGDTTTAAVTSSGTGDDRIFTAAFATLTAGRYELEITGVDNNDGVITLYQGILEVVTPFGDTTGNVTHNIYVQSVDADINVVQNTSYAFNQNIISDALGKGELVERGDTTAQTIAIPYKGAVSLTGAPTGAASFTIKAKKPSSVTDADSDNIVMWEGYFTFYCDNSSVSFTNVAFVITPTFVSGYSYLVKLMIPMPIVANDLNNLPVPIPYIGVVVARGKGVDWEPVVDSRKAKNTVQGAVKLTDSFTSTLNSTSGGTAATPLAVKYAYDRANVAINNAGYPANLDTIAKTNLVAAINEVKASVAAASGFCTLDWANAVAIPDCAYSQYMQWDGYVVGHYERHDDADLAISGIVVAKSGSAICIPLKSGNTLWFSAQIKEGLYVVPLLA